MMDPTAAGSGSSGASSGTVTTPADNNGPVPPGGQVPGPTMGLASVPTPGQAPDPALSQSRASIPSSASTQAGDGPGETPTGTVAILTTETAGEPAQPSAAPGCAASAMGPSRLRDGEPPTPRRRTASERLDAVLGRMVTSAGLLPGLALVWTIYSLMYPIDVLGGDLIAVVPGLFLALVSWVLFALVTIRYGYASGANGSQFQELRGRLSHLEARLSANAADQAVAAYQEAVSDRDSIGGIIALDPGGVAWTTGGGYVSLWQRVHRAEEALLEVSPDAIVVAEGEYDKARLTGSKIENADSLLKTVQAAIDVLDRASPGNSEGNPPAAPAPGGTTAVADAAKEVAAAKSRLRTVRRTVNEYRDECAFGLVQLRRRMTQSLVLTGTVAYLVLALSIVAKVTPDVILVGCGYFLVGAVVGLLHRVQVEMGLRSDVEDYGLSTARLLHAPVLSGLAAVGGVVLIGLLVAPPFGLGVVSGTTDGNTVSGLLSGLLGTAAPANTIADVFSLETYPVAIIVAAVFGLTPGLFFDRLRQVGEGLKTDIQTSSAAGENADTES
jgi:hypothetical protein